MTHLFKVLFLDEAYEFLNSLESKHAEKIIYNIRKAQTIHDPELFKKLNEEFGSLEPCIKVYNIGY